jgi:hypothetical protein
LNFIHRWPGLCWTLWPEITVLEQPAGLAGAWLLGGGPGKGPGRGGPGWTLAEIWEAEELPGHSSKGQGLVSLTVALMDTFGVALEAPISLLGSWISGGS